MKINYELVYKTINAGLPSLQSLSSLEANYIWLAKEKAKKEFQLYIDYLSTLAPKDMEIEVTEVLCMAKGIPKHVYIFSSWNTSR